MGTGRKVLSVDHLRKEFASTVAVDDLSFAVEEGQILVIVGGSGCGKTTTLRCIAGLEEPTAGRITLGDRPIYGPGVSVPPEDRGIGMMFQSYALWPHMTVYDNVAYGLRQRRLGAAAIKAQVGATLETVGLAGMAARLPSTLSGGQQQRVALARSAVMRPALLLLDEPLSNLDAKMREEMRDELRRMIKDLSMTAVHITHDQSEAMALADTVICMRAGRVEQIGPPREIYRHPRTRYVAEFLGGANCIAVGELGPGVIATVAQALMNADACREPPACICIRPEDIDLSARDGGAGWASATVLSEIYLGARTRYAVSCEGQVLQVDSALDLRPEQPCFVHLDPVKATLVV